MTRPFIPPHPPRRPKPVASWRGFFGERARTAVYGWSQFAFEADHLKRQILGFTVHVLLNPDAVQRVLLDNAGNYAKPDIVKSLLDPIIGRGLLTSDGQLWREQRRIVAAASHPPRSTRNAQCSSRRHDRRWPAGATASGATWLPRRPGRR